MITADSYAAPTRFADSNVLGRDRRVRREQSFNPNFDLNPEFALTRPGYHVRLADNSPVLQTKARQLVTNMYGARGLDTANVSQPRPPGQFTLAACCGDHVFGTLTLGVGTPDSLLAATLYRDEIKEVRQNCGRVGEVTRLALDSEFSSPDVLAAIFNLAFILARNVHQMTDLFAEVHPRHSGFYRRLMGYQIAGPERICPRVGAPAVLMHLCLDYAEDKIRKLAGNLDSGERSLYRLFLPPSEQNELLTKLLVPMSVAA